MLNLEAWAAPARATRDDDTAREINDDPTAFAHKRGSANLPEIVGRILTPNGLPNRPSQGQGSQSADNGARLLFRAGADVKRDDRLVAPGGAAYRVFYVYPNQRDRTLAAAEVVSR